MHGGCSAPPAPPLNPPMFQALLEGANLMDVRDVGDACYDYMQRHIDTDNCGINKGISLTINAPIVCIVVCF